MASPLHRTLCDGRAVRVKAAMRTVNDDAQTLHFSCSAHHGRGHPRTAASPISRDMLIGIHVLVVENSATTREMLRAAMEYCGAFVTLASSVAEGKAIFREVRPCVIVSDISMPNSGVELVRDAIETAFKIPSIAITTARDSREQAKEAGFAAFVLKPLDPFVLVLVVKPLAKGTHRHERLGHRRGGLLLRQARGGTARRPTT
jgi:CheY-like chemotaxis protein